MNPPSLKLTPVFVFLVIISFQIFAVEYEESIAQQQAMVAYVSGHDPSGLGPRSTIDERHAAEEYIFKKLNEIGLSPQRHHYRFPNTNGLVDLLIQPFKGTNVLAILESTNPHAEYIVMGAHYDSESKSPGAGDNATGIALVYTLAKQLQKLQSAQHHFIFIFFDQEEDDEVGSKAFAKWLKNAEYPVHSVHITDLSGWDKDDDGVIEIQTDDAELREWYQAAAVKLGLQLKLTTGGSSDNKSFMKAGYRTTGVFGDVRRELHKPTDTYKTVSFELLNNMTHLMFEVMKFLTTEGDTDAP